MVKDTLFLLKPGFEDQGEGPFYCPDCAGIEGLLSFYPQLKDLIDVQYVDFRRPRQPIVDMVGTDNQGAPVLVLGEGERDVPRGVVVREYQGKLFINDAMEIALYLSLAYDVAKPHS